MFEKLKSKFSRLYFGELPLPEPKPKCKPTPDVTVSKPETEEVWELRIYIEGMGNQPYTFTNEEIRPLWKIYHWFLVRDSDKYNLEYNDGMVVLLRDNILTMQLKKITQIKKI